MNARPAGSIVLATVVLTLCGLLAAGAASQHQQTPPTLFDAAQASSAAQTMAVPAPEVAR